MSNESVVQGDGPLAGIRVLDVSTMLAAPLVGQILGDFGADVVKIEHPKRPDMMRGHGAAVNGHPLWWKEVSRNKRTVGLDLKDPAGAELLLELVRTADVLVENFRPGTLEKWDLGWERLRSANPRLILLRVTGFGQDGPYSDRAGFGTLVEAMSGFAAVTGQPDGPPTLPPFGLADSFAGMAGAAAVSMALFHRDARGGEGQVIDLSLLEPIMLALGAGPTVYDKLGILQPRQGNRAVSAPRNLYRTRDDQWVAVSTSATTVAARVMRLVGHPEVVDAPWFDTASGRWEHVDLVDGYVADWIGARTRDEAIAAFTEAEAAIAPVYTAADLIDDPQVRAREMLVRVPDDDLGDLLQHNVLFRMSATPGQIRFTGRAPGADTDTILEDELGIPRQRVDELRQRGVVD